MSTTSTLRRRVALALQGGGAHGAYSWGVIDRLLSEDIEIVSVSGTSAGALNGSALVAGMASGGIDGARAVLEKLWHNTSRLSPLGALHVPDFWPLAPVMDAFIERGLDAVKMTSPYFAPYFPCVRDMSLLREVVSESIDIALLADASAIPLHIAATHVSNGQSRIFKGSEISLDAIMASACLPDLFSPVEINGELYWDGGYSANPALEPLVFDDGPVDDVLVVQVTPFAVSADLYTLSAVLRRTSDISFNACLMRDLKALAEIQRLAREGTLEHERLKNLRIHLLRPPASVAEGSKIDTRWSTISRLRREGYERMSNWLEEPAFGKPICSAEDVFA